MIPPMVHDVLRSPGQPLDAAARAVMEARFGHDFSRVRIHTDSQAADSVRSVNALAYTVGQDVVFGHGQYRPTSSDGQRLIAHELTHTIQQAGGAALRESGRSEIGLESEAEAASHAALEGRGVRVASNAPLGLSRQAPPGNVQTPPSGATRTPAPPSAGTATNTIDGFVTGSAVISPENWAKLQGIASRIQATLKDRSDNKVLVVGHTDAQGTEANNMALGMRRAESTRDALVKMGVPAQNIQTVSKGQSEPVDDSGKKDNPRNRRAEVKFEEAAPTAPSAPPSPKKVEPDVPRVEPKIFGDICTLLPDLCKLPPPGPQKPNLPPDFWKPLPPPPKGAKPKSALDVLNEKVVDPVVKSVTKGLPKDVQEKAKDLAHAAVEKGITGGLGAALGAWGVDSKGQTAIINAVDAALKEKGQSPGGQ
jgi:outer membrane protein OmpA-like peptidoglycan-associated protein